MFCRVCLRKNMKVYYKCNNKYIDLMETITEVKMKLNDLVCCFCLATLRQIENFTEMAKEVDTILKQSVKLEEDGNEVSKYYNLVVSATRNISIDCSRALYETYACNIRDALLRQVERDLVKIEETEDDPHQLPDDTIIDSETDSTSDVPLLTVTVNKEEQNESTDQNDEPHQLPEGSIVDNETDSEDDVPLVITKPHIRDESNKLLDVTCDDETTETNGGYYILKPLRICLRRVDEDIGLIEQPREEHSGQQPNFNNIINNEPSDRKKEHNVREVNEKYNAETKLAASDKPFSCDILVCGYRSSSKSILSSHIRAHTEAVLPKQLKSTSSREGNNKVVTELARGQVVEQNKTHRRRNKIDKNDVLSIAISKQYVDTICPSDKPFSCYTCAFRAKCKSKLAIHIRTHTGEKPFSCNICSFKCSQKNNLRVHLGTHTCEKPFACNICSYKCSQKYSLKLHLRTHTREKPFACNICSYKCSQKSSLTTHLRTHTREKPFACNICSYKCNQKNSLTRHLTTHTGEKGFACNFCSYKCSQKSSLTTHLTTHTGEKPFSCNICSYKCSQKISLKLHLRTHTSEKPFACNICSYKCSQKNSLRVHLRKHTGEKPFACNICSYKCSQKIHLTRHLTTHTGEKPFACYICSYKCSQKSHLATHLTTHTSEKPFACNICSYKFSQKSSLTTHLRTHTCEKPFECNVCSYKCSRKGNLTRHLKSHSRSFSCDVDI